MRNHVAGAVALFLSIGCAQTPEKTENNETAASATSTRAPAPMMPPPSIAVVEIVTMKSGLGEPELKAMTEQVIANEKGVDGLVQHYFVRMADGKVGGVLVWRDEAARRVFREQMDPAKLAELLKLDEPLQMELLHAIDKVHGAVRADADTEKPDAILAVSGMKFGIPMSEAMKVKNRRKAAFQKEEELRQKFFGYDPATMLSGGVYLWSSRAAAEAYLASPMMSEVKQAYKLETDPEVRVFDIDARLRE
jgi:hypothetical protein